MPSGGGSKSLFDRAKDIILHPASEWPVIEREPATIASIYMPYVLVLAAIGPIAGLIGGQVFGYSYGPLTWRPPIGTALVMAVLSYVISLGMVFVLALIIDALAPSFGGSKNQVNAFKVAAYSWTAAWLAGIFTIIPPLGILAIVGLYSFYLLYLGLPVMMKVPPDKAVGYVVVVILAAIVLWVLVTYVVYRLMFTMMVGQITPGLG